MADTTDITAPTPGSATSTSSDTTAANEQSLADMANVPVESLNAPASPTPGTKIMVIDGHEAASSDPSDAAYGMAHTTAEGEVGGGNIKRILDPPDDATMTAHPLTKERAALLSPVARAIAGYVQRPVSEWGVLGPGDTVRGHMLLLDLQTGEKVRGMDGHKIGEGKLYANLRNMPEALSTGDTIEQLLAAR